MSASQVVALSNGVRVVEVGGGNYYGLWWSVKRSVIIGHGRYRCLGLYGVVAVGYGLRVGVLEMP
jgi:hypothetical protein